MAGIRIVTPVLSALALAGKMMSADYYRQAPDVLRGDQARNAELERLLEEKLERWTMLEGKKIGV